MSVKKKGGLGKGRRRRLVIVRLPPSGNDTQMQWNSIRIPLHDLFQRRIPKFEI